VVTTDTAPPSIVHLPIVDPQPANVAVAITATVSDPSGVDEVRLYFRAQGGAVFLSALLTKTAANRYDGEIPAGSVIGGGIEYYLEATDASPEQNLGRDPIDAPATLHAFQVTGGGEDLVGPTIVHTPIPDGQQAGSVVQISARIEDPSGISTVTLSFRGVGEADFTTVPMTLFSGTTFTAEIPGDRVIDAGVEYYLSASDASPAMNASTSPTGAPGSVHTFTVGDGEPMERPDRDEGCSCSTRGSDAGTPWLLLALGVALWVRRRR
jgi:MYXO-CTERM domain-containing protein